MSELPNTPPPFKVGLLERPTPTDAPFTDYQAAKAHAIRLSRLNVKDMTRTTRAFAVWETDGESMYRVRIIVFDGVVFYPNYRGEALEM